MLVAGLAQEAPVGLQDAGDRLVGVEDLQAGDVLQRRLREHGQELAALVHGEDHGDAVFLADLLVIFAVGRCLVDNTRTVGGGDVVGRDNPPRVLRPPLLRVGVDVPQRCVADPGQVLTLVDGGDRRAGGVGVVVAQVLGVRADQVLGEEEAPLARLRSVGARGHDGVADLGPDGEGHVGGQGPGRGGPGDGLDPCQLGGERGAAVEQREGDRDRLVLAHLVHVVVHAQFMVGQRRLVLPAVREHPETAVGQALFVQGLEGPDDRFHVLDVERLVIVFEVDPAGLAGDVVLPLTGVLHYGGTAGIVELVDAHLLDLDLVAHAQLLHGFQLGRQAVGVPAEAALHPAAALGLVAGHQVLDVAGQQVAVVRQAVGEGRTVVEDKFVVTVAAGGAGVNGGLERAVLVPVLQNAFFEFRKPG